MYRFKKKVIELPLPQKLKMCQCTDFEVNLWSQTRNFFGEPYNVQIVLSPNGNVALCGYLFRPKRRKDVQKDIVQGSNLKPLDNIGKAEKQKCSQIYT